MAHIRRISVHVDEPEPGHFYWVLMEEVDDASQWNELESADEAYDLWLDALQGGMKRLIGYALDERVGPREDGDDEEGAPVGIPIK
ncbi:hypothetical protein [Variovorax paradoxus]|uniref:Uncharacterized protein n=1 Tax=Variovorax paradoxus TaxID=34073 RepID=A0A679JL62_VARPD|nr:hypothetical protein VVAX_05992 [Variovorax paradoxus]